MHNQVQVLKYIFKILMLEYEPSDICFQDTETEGINLKPGMKCSYLALTLFLLSES